MAVAIACAALLVGMALGAIRPLLGLCVLVGFVAVTPSLLWQIGRANFADPLLYSLGLLVGERLGRRRDLDGGGLAGGRITRAAELAILTLLVAAAVAFARGTPLNATAFGVEPSAALSELATFNPDGLAGTIRATLIPLTGLLLFRMTLRVLAAPAARSRFVVAFVVGCLVVAAAPAVQWAFLDPTVRPDRGSTDSVGLGAWFHDPHALAAYLVLAIGFLLGMAAEQRRRGAAAEFRIDWRLATGMAAWLSALLLFTNSRSGLGAAVVCLAAFAALVWPLGSPELPRERRRQRLRIAAGVLALLVAVGAAVIVSPAVRTFAYRALSGLGNARMWEPLQPGGPEHPLLIRRQLLWSKALKLMADNPIWGVGPGGYRLADVPVSEATRERIETTWGADELPLVMLEVESENAHSYFLQYGAEFGIPALASLSGLLLLVVGVTARHALRRGAPGGALAGGLVAGEIGFLAISLVSHPLLLAEMQPLFWSLAAFALIVSRPRPGPGHRG